MIALGMMFSLHAGSISDALTTEERPMGVAIARGLLVYLALGLLLYLPAGRLLSRVVRVYNIQQDFRPFNEGDVLVAHRLGRPQTGDVVVYERPNVAFVWGHIGGPGADRVLAVGGEHVQSSGTKLLVNGVERTCRPLNPIQLPAFELDVPAGFVLIGPRWLGPCRWIRRIGSAGF